MTHLEEITPDTTGNPCAIHLVVLAPQIRAAAYFTITICASPWSACAIQMAVRRLSGKNLQLLELSSAKTLLRLRLRRTGRPRLTSPCYDISLRGGKSRTIR